MPTPAETIWNAEPHTLAKHEILRRYLGAWFPILSTWHGRIIYLDGFAGPGEYQGGEPGSPIVALEVAANHRSTLANDVIFWFIDERQDRIGHLRSLVEQRTWPKNFKIHIECRRFDEALREVLDELDKSGATIAPTFAFIDPFGFSGVPMGLWSYPVLVDSQGLTHQAARACSFSYLMGDA